MTTLQIEHAISDFEVWKKAFATDLRRVCPLLVGRAKPVRVHTTSAS